MRNLEEIWEDKEETLEDNERHERSDLITIIIRINMDENERSRRKYGDDMRET